MSRISKAPRHLAHLTIRGYQLGLSGILGRQCRHLPTCSHFTDEAIQRHGLWIGGWMGLARLLRCQPWGTAGYDPVPAHPSAHAKWWLPWRYGQWRGPLAGDVHALDPADYERAASTSERASKRNCGAGGKARKVAR